MRCAVGSCSSLGFSPPNNLQRGAEPVVTPKRGRCGCWFSWFTRQKLKFVVLPLSSSCDRRSDRDAKALGDRRGLSSVLARGKTSPHKTQPQELCLRVLLENIWFWKMILAAAWPEGERICEMERKKSCSSSTKEKEGEPPGPGKPRVRLWLCEEPFLPVLGFLHQISAFIRFFIEFAAFLFFYLTVHRPPAPLTNTLLSLF